MLHMLQLSPKHFQSVPGADKRAMQHECDMLCTCPRIAPPAFRIRATKNRHLA